MGARWQRVLGAVRGLVAVLARGARPAEASRPEPAGLELPGGNVYRDHVLWVVEPAGEVPGVAWRCRHGSDGFLGGNFVGCPGCWRALDFEAQERVVEGCRPEVVRWGGGREVVANAAAGGEVAR